MTGENILVIKLGAFGDFVQALGPMKSIRAHHPDAHITLLTTAPFKSLAQASHYFNDIWIDERPKFYQFYKWLTLRRLLNGKKFSRVYDLQNNDRTELYLSLFSTPPLWVGAARKATIRNNSPLRTAGSGFEGHVQTLGMAGIADIEIDKMEWINGTTFFPGLVKPYILFAPGSAPTRPEKRWPASSYAAIAQRLIEQNIQPVLLGTAAEKESAEEIMRLCPSALDLSGQTSLFDIVSLARGALAALGNDTGPMHMMAPVGIPCLVLFSGHSNPRRHAPPGHNVISVQEPVLRDLSPDAVWKILADQLALSPSS